MSLRKGHTFVNVLALIHDYQATPLSAVRTTWEESSLRGFDGLPFLSGGVVSWPLLVLEVL